MNRVVVAIEDGAVAGVYSTDQELEVIVVDIDSTAGEDDDVIIEIPGVERHTDFLHEYREGIKNVPALADLVAWLKWKE